MVMETCKNPRNPTFSHYLFESVAALLRHADDPALIGTFEQCLFPPFQAGPKIVPFCSLLQPFCSVVYS